MRRVVPLAILAIAVVAGGTLSLRGADDKKMSISDVMKARNKDKLHEKFSKGETSADEKKTLLEGYEAMAAAKPPKGDEKSWKEKTDALVKAVKDDDKDGLKKAVNCKSCHDVHRETQKK